eukprot:g10318.t1
MAASVKIEFDDGSRVIRQTLEEAAGAGVTDARAGSPALSVDKRPSSCSIHDFYEIPKTVAFIAGGNFRRVALQFPDGLLREAPEVLWTLQARLRKPTPGAVDGSPEEGAAAAAGAAAPPLIFVTGDTSYGSCCVDEVSAQHLKADAIVHYGRACLSPTNSSVPVLYVFGRGSLDVDDLASALLKRPLSLHAPPAADATDAEPPASSSTTTSEDGGAPPVLLLYDVTYAHAIPALLERLAGFVQNGRLVVGFPTPEAYSPVGTRGSSSSSSASVSQGAGCECGATSMSTSAPTPSGGQHEQQQPPLLANGGGGDVEAGCRRSSDPGAQGAGGCCTVDRKMCSDGDGGGRGEAGGCAQDTSQAETVGERTEAPGALAAGVGCSPREQEQPPAAAAAAAGSVGTATGTPTPAPTGEGAHRQEQHQQQQPSEKRRIRIGGLGVDLESEEDLQRHTLVFVGGEGRQLSNVLMRCAGCVDRLRYDPALPPGERVVGDTRKGNKDLMRRYYLVQRAREAGIIGIVVGTLGVQRYGSVVRELRKMVEDAGRKAYTLAVGKVNVAKLANFAEVEVFCLVACAENSLLDSREFHAPVVTPLELEVALGRREWGGFYSTDFDDLVGLGPQDAPGPGTDPDIGCLTLADSAADGRGQPPTAAGGANGAMSNSDADEEEENDRPFFSLVTGTYRNKPGGSRRPEAGRGGGAGGCSVDRTAEGGASGGALVGIGDRSLVEWSSPAADFLGKREFQGLEALVGQTEAKPATEGQSGIASDYGGV